MNNLIRFLAKEQRLTYQEIADRIAAASGRRYSPHHLGNVARGTVPISDGLRYNLLLAFPDLFLSSYSPNG